MPAAGLSSVSRDHARGLGARARHDVDLVTNQSVEALPTLPMCRYEIRSLRSHPVLFQRGTYAPDDGVCPLMASVARYKKSDIAELPAPRRASIIEGSGV